MSWAAERFASWPAPWRAWWAEAEQLVDQVAAAPGQYVDRVVGFITALEEARATLDRGLAMLRGMPASLTPADEAVKKALFARYNHLNQVYHDLTVPILLDARIKKGDELVTAERLSTGPSLGFSPWVPIVGVGVLLLGVAACAWAFSRYETAAAVREEGGRFEQEVALRTEELRARVEAMRTGRMLQPSTVPDAWRPGPLATNAPPNPDGEGWEDWEIAAAAGAVTLALVGLAAFATTRGR